jgi:hypothetical protein
MNKKNKWISMLIRRFSSVCWCRHRPLITCCSFQMKHLGRRKQFPIGLILAPTRELAIQILDEAKKVGVDILVYTVLYTHLYCIDQKWNETNSEYVSSYCKLKLQTQRLSLDYKETHDVNNKNKISRKPLQKW